MEIIKIISDYINKNLIVFDEDINISNDDDIFKLGYVNSLFSVKLLNFLEKQFNITVDNSELDINNFSTINNITKLINKKLK